MNAISKATLLQKVTRFTMNAAGRTTGFGLAALLVTFWILTAPLLHLAVFLGDVFRRGDFKKTPKHGTRHGISRSVINFEPSTECKNQP